MDKKGDCAVTINKAINGNTLEITLEGRLDTMTAPELEAELNQSLPGADRLVLDFFRRPAGSPVRP